MEHVVNKHIHKISQVALGKSYEMPAHNKVGN